MLATAALAVGLQVASSASADNFSSGGTTGWAAPSHP
jgi:hypothetical protein